MLNMPLPGKTSRQHKLKVMNRYLDTDGKYDYGVLPADTSVRIAHLNDLDNLYLLDSGKAVGLHLRLPLTHFWANP